MRALGIRAIVITRQYLLQPHRRPLQQQRSNVRENNIMDLLDQRKKKGRTEKKREREDCIRTQGETIRLDTSCNVNLLVIITLDLDAYRHHVSPMISYTLIHFCRLAHFDSGDYFKEKEEDARRAKTKTLAPVIKKEEKEQQEEGHKAAASFFLRRGERAHHR